MDFSMSGEFCEVQLKINWWLGSIGIMADYRKIELGVLVVEVWGQGFKRFLG